MALGGCLGDSDLESSALEGGTASVALGKAPRTLDPALGGDAVTRSALWLVYTSPLTYRRAEGEGGTELVPGLARALPEVSDDGLTYTFRVRRGLRFSNGAPLRARDVRHSIVRAGELPGRGRELFANVLTIDADDRTGTVSLNLSAPDPSFPHALAALEAGAVPRGTPIRPAPHRSPPPGLGPYRISTPRVGSGFTLLRNRDFELQGVPGGLIDAFRLMPAGTPAEQAQAVKAGRLDVMTATPPAGQLPELRSEYGARYSEPPDLATRYLGIRTEGGPLERPELREALAYGVDETEVARRLDGLARPTCSLLPPGVRGYEEPDPCPWGDPEEPADLVRARELVVEAGEEGTPVTIRAAPADRALARLFAGTLRKIGLGAVLQRGGDADVTLATATMSLPDPAQLVVPLARRVPLDADPRAVLLADELSTETDPDEAARLATELDRELVAAAVAIPYAGVPRTLFLSARIDVDNCLRVHPVYGVDLSGLCVR
jgi:peptide/nickel transport system substrate-binding protein